MKKFLVVFIGLVMIAPAWADEPSITQYVSPTHASTQNTATVSANAPKYDLRTISATDQEHIASTAYVKGAHNSALSAINYLSDAKQEQLVGNSETVATGANAGNTLGQASGSSGPVVTGISASGGVVTVTKGQVTLPVGSSSGTGGQATIWIQ